MRSIGQSLRVIGGEFGGLLLYWLALWRFGVKPAIAVALAFVLLDGLRRLVTRQPVTRVWLLANGVALASGVIDLQARALFMIRYEAVASNVLTGLVFLLGAFGRRSMIQEIAESWQGGRFAGETPELRVFFRTFTLVWAGYFFVKAAVYAWLITILPLERALAIRAVAGTSSFVVMILLSRQGKAIFRLSRRLGLFRPRPA